LTFHPNRFSPTLFATRMSHSENQPLVFRAGPLALAIAWKLLFVFAAILLPSPRGVAGEPIYQAGVARTDITPSTPIRLSGYGARRTETSEIDQRLWAKALAIGRSGTNTALILTVDNCGVPTALREELLARLENTAIHSDRFALCSTHTHAGPCLSGNLENLFSQDIPPDHQERIDAYTKELLDKLEQVSRAALDNLLPSLLAWGEGRATFAGNRRTPGGPVDHALPILRVSDTNGQLRAILANYACHCTTLGGDFNKVHGDWAGCAQEFIERDHPGVTALISIGCGADSNPHPRGTLDLVRQHGEELAAEVKRLAALPLTPIRGEFSARTRRIELPFAPLPDREEWDARAKQSGIVGYHARKNLARLDRGESLPAHLPYLVQTWNFGDDLAMVFLPGEVVVDYVVRLKNEFDSERLWVTAYANDVPCYIPSRRILSEGGYEAEGSLWYYDQPARLAPETEELIIQTVHQLLPKTFAADPRKAEFPPPKSPEQSLALFQIKPGLEVKLAASEPLIVDPVAIDFGADGKLWVVEMHDYPTGLDGNLKPGGRIKILEDLDGDGRYDRSTLFLDGLPFPTGLMAWKKGVLVCAAPDLLYAEDTTGDGKADHVETLFTGFATHNYQARLNSLRWGLDGWIHGASGLFGGKISSPHDPRIIELTGRDFRILPDQRRLEPVHGLSQQGRVRDDFGNWFGCDNSTLLWHFPFPDHYGRRNPHVAPPDSRVFPLKGREANQLFPISRTLERFNDPAHVNRVTSASGLEIYRDNFLGDEFYGNAFVCESVHNLVHRLVLAPNGVTFSGARPADEQRSEFLASRDNWFRPVEARTGPDGALWVVDMYRFVIEHPRWIPPDRLAQLDLRAGSDMGRIYRVVPRNKKPRVLPNIASAPVQELIAAFATANGPGRDLIHQELLSRPDPSAIEPMKRLALANAPPAPRVQAMSVLADLKALNPDVLEPALADSSPQVRTHALRFSEPLFDSSSALQDRAVQLANDPDMAVRFQLALSLGAWSGPAKAAVLHRLLENTPRDPWMRAAVLNSAGDCPEVLLRLVLQGPNELRHAQLIGPLVTIACARGDKRTVREVANLLLSGPALKDEWELAALDSLLEALARFDEQPGDTALDRTQLRSTMTSAQDLAFNKELPEPMRVAALKLFRHSIAVDRAQLDRLLDEMNTGLEAPLRQAAIEALTRNDSPEIPRVVLERWSRSSPLLRPFFIELFAAREGAIRLLFQGIEEGTISSGEISAAQQQRFSEHRQKEIREQAIALFGERERRAGPELIAKFEKAIAAGGNVSRGNLLFEQHCASCHSFDGRGHIVGPDLEPFRAKPPADLLLAILDPNAAIEPAFVAYDIETRDGRSLAGIVKAETAGALTLVQGGGLIETILKTDIREWRASSLSLMPEGFEQSIRPSEMADLIAYMRQQPAAFGSATPGQADKARAEFLRENPNGLGEILFRSEQLNYPSWLGPLPLAHCRQNDGASKVIWRTAPVPTALAPGSFHRFVVPAAMGHLSQPPGRFALKLNGQPVLDFNVTLQSRTWRSADEKVRMTYTVLERNREDSNGVLAIEIAAEALQPSGPATFEVIGSAAKSQRWFGVYQIGVRSKH
jgi:putative membrane-bound dehydrogenase-like protein